jgi:hypothetical protein
VPHLRIIDDHLWSQVKEREQGSRSRVMTKDKGISRSVHADRTTFSPVSSNVAPVAAPSRNKGTCNNRLTVRRDELEAKVLDGLRDQLMHPELVTTFIDEFHKEVNRQRAEQDGRRDRTAREQEKAEREIRRVIQAIKTGVPGAAVKDEMTTLEARRVELQAQLKAAPLPMPRLHPNLAELYRQKVVNLAEALNGEVRLEAAECIRELIEEIRLYRKMESSGSSSTGSLQHLSISQTNTPAATERGCK